MIFGVLVTDVSFLFISHKLYIYLQLPCFYFYFRIPSSCLKDICHNMSKACACNILISKQIELYLKKNLYYFPYNIFSKVILHAESFVCHFIFYSFWQTEQWWPVVNRVQLIIKDNNAIKVWTALYEKTGELIKRSNTDTDKDIIMNELKGVVWAWLIENLFNYHTLQKYIRHLW